MLTGLFRSTGQTVAAVKVCCWDVTTLTAASRRDAAMVTARPAVETRLSSANTESSEIGRQRGVLGCVGSSELFPSHEIFVCQEAR